MSWVAAVVAVVLGAAAVALAVIILRFARKARHIAAAAGAATPQQLERIYALVEGTGTVASTGYVLARTNQRAAGQDCLVPIPQALHDFPWAGQVVEVTVSDAVRFRFTEAAASEPVLLGQVYRPVRVPRRQAKRSGKAHNVFAPDGYLAGNPELQQALQAVCPRHPAELLSYLLCAGRASHEFEPIDQVRIGTSAAWVQDPEPQACDRCGQRMGLVLQLPGTVISKKAFRRGTFYLFGCVAHPDQTKTLGQYT